MQCLRNWTAFQSPPCTRPSHCRYTLTTLRSAPPDRCSLYAADLNFLRISRPCLYLLWELAELQEEELSRWCTPWDCTWEWDQTRSGAIPPGHHHSFWRKRSTVGGCCSSHCRSSPRATQIQSWSLSSYFFLLCSNLSNHVIMAGYPVFVCRITLLLYMIWLFAFEFGDNSWGCSI